MWGIIGARYVDVLREQERRGAFTNALLFTDPYTGLVRVATRAEVDRTLAVLGWYERQSGRRA